MSHSEVIDEYLELGFPFHGHRCPDMPLGVRAGLLALDRLGVKRSEDKELHCLVEVGPSHPMMCFLDGVQVATGCTYGKGNVEKLNYGKLAFTLIDKATKRVVRVAITEKLFKDLFNSRFVQTRLSGVPPQDVPKEIADEAIRLVLKYPEEEAFKVDSRLRC